MKKTDCRRPRLCITMFLLMSMGAASAYALERFTFSADGSEVVDQRTGLTWRRCSEGQAWTGSSCNGSPMAFTHQQALEHARAQSGWRLPNVKELVSIVDRSRRLPAIDPMAFPQTPSVFYWTSSPYAGGAGNVWYVNFDDGGANYFFDSPGGGGRVRLVR